ncbi:cysteine-rich CWC family protein [Salinispirillum sp. LH 10-3-1]|uniref:cysteine-rich CWC family protein n=1 Tax=Salinispirillum sp. LH 10-3-1 TaxID=2952525 RepID=UPI00272AD34F
MEPLPNLHCPVCGEPNACAPAASGSFDTPCWCTEVVIDPDALAKIPEHLRQQACLCKRCATKESANVDTRPDQ